MQTIPSITTVVNGSSFSVNLSLKIKNLKAHSFSSPSKILNYEIPPYAHSSSTPHMPGLCRASQVAELFPTTSPEIVVREARIEDCWEVAETHCSSFFPEYSFPLDFVLRFDRLLGMLFGFSIPKGCNRTCLVAVIGSSGEDSFFVGSDEFKIGGFEGKFSLNKGYVAGILTIDTVADFLPRKGPLRQRRRGIAYISNVAVREKFRRKGIAKRLIAKAEAKAKTWGCRAIALHCDHSNPGATKLYSSQGFKIIKIPSGANWPHPRISADVQFNFMMKLLHSSR
ncbi:Acyl-CoA N-acyltransferases superfamily protein [Perilla frutescens var. hirtella]|nr:Acyl-CoA N-acyltransferases superfamily protein [Perilla frutescens var. hirtella]